MLFYDVVGLILPMLVWYCHCWLGVALVGLVLVLLVWCWACSLSTTHVGLTLFLLSRHCLSLCISAFVGLFLSLVVLYYPWWFMSYALLARYFACQLALSFWV